MVVRGFFLGSEDNIVGLFPRFGKISKSYAVEDLLEVKYGFRTRIFKHTVGDGVGARRFKIG